MNRDLIRSTATALADVLRRQETLKQEATDLIQCAKDDGLDVKAIRKVAREMVMDSEKRSSLYEHEQNLDLFRDVVGLTAPAFAEAAE